MARVFERPNTSHDWKCPVCRTANEAQVILVPIPGTEKDGIVEAQQFHLRCANIVAMSVAGIKDTDNG